MWPVQCPWEAEAKWRGRPGSWWLVQPLCWATAVHGLEGPGRHHSSSTDACWLAVGPDCLSQVTTGVHCLLLLPLGIWSDY